MALRWDLKPAFPNAPEDSERALWTRRSVIAAATAFTGSIAITWTMDFWTTAVILAIVGLAFDAGDHRNPYVDDEDIYGEPIEGDGYDLYHGQR